MSTFVSVGNATQPFDRLLLKVAEIADRLPAPLFVQHGSTPFSCPNAICSALVPMDEFARRMEQARLVITHAGAGSVIHAIRAGKVPVVMPRRASFGEHVDDHQLEFARELSDTGKIVVAEEPGDLMAAVQEAIRRQAQLRPSDAVPPVVALVAEALRKCAAELKG